MSQKKLLQADKIDFIILLIARCQLVNAIVGNLTMLCAK